MSFSKKIVLFCLINAVLWVWCSYLLAYLGRVDIAESLSEEAVTAIIGVAIGYFTKALLEKRSDFGSVGKSDTKDWSDRV